VGGQVRAIEYLLYSMGDDTNPSAANHAQGFAHMRVLVFFDLAAEAYWKCPVKAQKGRTKPSCNCGDPTTERLQAQWVLLSRSAIPSDYPPPLATHRRQRW